MNIGFTYLSLNLSSYTISSGDAPSITESHIIIEKERRPPNEMYFSYELIIIIDTLLSLRIIESYITLLKIESLPIIASFVFIS